jgi:hypothetical protein
MKTKKKVWIHVDLDACTWVSVSSFVKQDAVIEVRGHRFTLQSHLSQPAWRSAKETRLLLQDVSQKDQRIHSAKLSDYPFVCTKLPKEMSAILTPN